MLNATRYALAAVCLTASVGCVALWWISFTTNVRYIGPSYLPPRSTRIVEAYRGYGVVIGAKSKLPYRHWERLPAGSQSRLDAMTRQLSNRRMFGQLSSGFYFPLWYPAIVFALAAAYALRLGRQFTLRSALVGTGIVAALLGMVIAL